MDKMGTVLCIVEKLPLILGWISHRIDDVVNSLIFINV